MFRYPSKDETISFGIVCFIMLIALFQRDQVSPSATIGTQTKLPIKQQSSHSDFLMVKQPALWGNIQVRNGRTWKEVVVCEWQLRAYTDTEEAIKRTVLVLILHSATSFQTAGPCLQSIPYSIQEVPGRIFQWQIFCTGKILICWNCLWGKVIFGSAPSLKYFQDKNKFLKSEMAVEK